MRERNANFWKCEGWSVIIASTSWGRERERERVVYANTDKKVTSGCLEL